MTREDEEYLLDSIEQLRKEAHRNNIMLCDIIGVLNAYLINHSRENEEDFMRNVWANLISSGIDLGAIFKRR